MFFIATLRGRAGGEQILRCKWAYCVIAYFKIIERIPYFRNVTYPVPDSISARISNNAHVRRKYPGCNEEYYKPFSVYHGHATDSRLLSKAVPLSKEREPNELARTLIPDVESTSPRWWEVKLDSNSVNTLLLEIKRVETLG